MNFEVWRDELQIFNKETVMEDSEEPIIHIWQSEKDNVVFVIGKDHKLVK